jgi:hypothetical protein
MNPHWMRRVRPKIRKKEHLVSGAFISPYNLMQGVSECESVVFLGPPPAFGGRRPHAEAAASPQGWPPPKTSLYIQKVFDCKWY